LCIGAIVIACNYILDSYGAVSIILVAKKIAKCIVVVLLSYKLGLTYTYKLRFAKLVRAEDLFVFTGVTYV